MSFFRCFDIDISSYLATSELILSFLPLTFPILVAIAFLGSHFIGAIVILSIKKRKNDIEDNGSLDMFSFIKIILRIKNNFKDKKYYKWNVLWLGLDILNLIIATVLIVFFYLFLLFLVKMVFTKLDKMNEFSGLMIILAFFWSFLFLEVVDRAKRYNNIISTYYIKIFTLCALSLGLVVIYNKENANKILNGKPQLEIELITVNNDTIISNPNLVYIGKTSNYLFLRNLEDKENIIHRMENIYELTMKKID